MARACRDRLLQKAGLLSEIETMVTRVVPQSEKQIQDAQMPAAASFLQRCGNTFQNDLVETIRANYGLHAKGRGPMRSSCGISFYQSPARLHCVDWRAFS